MVHLHYITQKMCYLLDQRKTSGTLSIPYMLIFTILIKFIIQVINDK